MNSTLGSATAWAKALPAGLARYASYEQWEPGRHLLLLNRKLLDVAARRIRRLMVFMPPRHGKSTMISLYFPTWWLGTFPDEEVILTSYEASYASTWGGRARDLMNAFGPELWDLRVSSDRRAASDWRLSGVRDGRPVTGGMRTAGVGTGITGRGGDLIVIDDPVKDAAQAQSETNRKNAWDWYQSTLYSRRNNEDAVIVLLMTRWHEDDLAGRILQHAEQQGEPWDVLNLPAICEDPTGDALGREEGEALWPERWSREALFEIERNMTPYWWSALYQQRPAPAAGNIFQRQWFRYWKPRGIDLPPPIVQLPGQPSVRAEVVDLPETFDDRLCAWDLTFSKGETSSYVVGQEWARRSGRFFLLDQTRRRMDFVETVAEFRAFSNAHPNTPRKLVEHAANGAALISTLRNDIPGIVPVSTRGDSKEERARAVSPYAESGNVYLPHPAIAPWVPEYIEELVTFPNARNDDQVDATSHALYRLSGGRAPEIEPLHY